MQNWKINLTGIALCAAAFTVIVGGINVAAGIAPLSYSLVETGLELGGLIGIGAVVLAALGGQTARDVKCLTVCTGISAVVAYLSICFVRSEPAHVLAACICAGFGLLVGALASTGTSYLHRS